MTRGGSQDSNLELMTKWTKWERGGQSWSRGSLLLQGCQMSIYLTKYQQLLTAQSNDCKLEFSSNVCLDEHASLVLAMVNYKNVLTCMLQDIYSFGNPASCGNTEMITEHRLLLHPPLSHNNHLVITKFRSLSGLPPLLYFRIHCPKLSFPLMSISKRHLVPKCICVYYRYLEFRQQSFSLILDSCNDKVSQMKYSTQKPDLVMSTSLL